LHFCADKIEVDEAAFKEACGVGVHVSEEDIAREVQTVLGLHNAALLEQRYAFPTGTLLKDLRTRLQWADGKLVKASLDQALFDLLGPKTAEDEAPKKVNILDNPPHPSPCSSITLCLLETIIKTTI
jgi:glutaminyl-tRNA synthetase